MLLLIFFHVCFILWSVRSLPSTTIRHTGYLHCFWFSFSSHENNVHNDLIQFSNGINSFWFHLMLFHLQSIICVSRATYNSQFPWMNRSLKWSYSARICKYPKFYWFFSSHISIKHVQCSAERSRKVNETMK